MNISEIRYKSIPITLFVLFIYTFSFSQSLYQNSQEKGYTDTLAQNWPVSNISDHEIMESWEMMPLYEPPAGALKSTSTLPLRVDNSQLKYFRPIFMQEGGSCSQASGVGYVFTYEINWLRNTDAQIKENRYPTHFTYNFLNGGGEKPGSGFPAGWRIIMDHGVPNVLDYGGGLYPLGLSGWMSGYDKYYQALKNKCITQWGKIPTDDAKGIETLKGWVHNHNREGEPYGGVASFYGKMTGIEYGVIPEGEHEAGKTVITQWGSSGGHAMTIVGYDERVCWDFNGDGQYTNDLDINGDEKVDVLDREKGSWIMANSWGPNYKDNGFAYIPYRLLATKRTNFAGVIYPDYHYTPRAVMQVNLNYEARNQLRFLVGVAYDENAENPLKTKGFGDSFNYKGGDIPMLGKEQTDSMELALDVTELTDDIDLKHRHTPVKFFFQVVAKKQEIPASGSVESMSVKFYENDSMQKEIFSEQGSIPIHDNSLTTLSALLPDSAYGTPVSTESLIRSESWCKVYASSEALNIEYYKTAGNARVEVFNIRGQLLLKQKLHSGLNRFHVPSTGIHIVRVSGRHESLTRKVLIY